MFKVIENPPPSWITRLRRGHWIWLVKEQEFAQVEFAHEVEPGFRTGRMGIRRFSLSENRYHEIQSWYVGFNGEGIDGSLLMLPTEGNLPDNPDPLPEPEVRKMQRTIADLEARVRNLENISRYCDCGVVW